jgi:hypothetical protein
LDPRDRERFQPLDFVDDDATQALECDLNRFPWEIDALVDTRRDTDPPGELARLDGLVMVSTGDNERDDQAGFVMGAKQREVFWGAHLDGDCPERIDDRRPQRHQWQRRWQFRAKEIVLSLVFGHPTSVVSS